MKRELQTFQDFLNEAVDPNYYQETFYFTMLISMTKEAGGSRDETKNDIRALPEVLTVTLVEKEKGGVQKDLGTKFMSTLKIHVRKPKDISKDVMMKRIVKMTARLKGVSVLRYKEKKPKQRRKAFHGAGSYVKRVANVQEGKKKSKKRIKGYQQNPARKRRLRIGFNRLTQTGPNNSGPFKKVKKHPSWQSAPPGAAGGLEEGSLDEVMKGPSDLPEGYVVVYDSSEMPNKFEVYYAKEDDPLTPLVVGDLEQMEKGNPVFGQLKVRRLKHEPYRDAYAPSHVKATDGFGPLLYDVALEIATKEGIGMRPDINSLTPFAERVWQVYHDVRQQEDDDISAVEADESLQVYYDMLERGEISPVELGKYLAEVGLIPMGYIGEMEDEDYEQALADFATENRYLTKIYRKDNIERQDELGDKFQELGAAPEPEAPKRSFDLSRVDRLREAIDIVLGGDDDLLAFDVQDELQQKIWNTDEAVRPGVKGALMDIVEEFMEGLDMDVDGKDVIITGSIANYNWSKFSDIDVHILIDFKEVNDNEEMVKRFFDSVRSNWNKLHNIHVKGHEVEIYIQDEHEPHISTGVDYLLDDRLLVKPNKIRPAIDRATATKKMRHMAREIDKLSAVFDSGDYEGAFDMAERIKNKLKKMRLGGLERSGIYSPENLAFKMLRRSGDIEQLFSIYTQAYDKIYSLDQ